MAWSPDLDCEFDSHWQVDRTEQSAEGSVGNLSQFSHLGDSHAEFSLSLQNDSTDRKSFKPFIAQALGVTSGTGGYVCPGFRCGAVCPDGPDPRLYSTRCTVHSRDLPTRTTPSHRLSFSLFQIEHIVADA